MSIPFIAITVAHALTGQSPLVHLLPLHLLYLLLSEHVLHHRLHLLLVNDLGVFERGQLSKGLQFLDLCDLPQVELVYWDLF